ncbi:MAG: DNA-directed RNA polymerase subunit B [archaeon]
MAKVETKPEKKKIGIYLNGRLIGEHEDTDALIKELKEMRTEGVIGAEVSISRSKDFDEVHINSDEGRIIRPLIKVIDGKPLITQEHLDKIKKGELQWSDLVSQGIVEYLDAAEEENTLVALRDGDITPEHTHLEIDPLTIFGICAGVVPFLNHNMATRVTLGANMSKQGIGVYTSNYNARADTQRHLMVYPQSPLVRTHGLDLINYDRRPSGQNFVVAIISKGGYNMQDAIIINKASIERGLGRSIFFRSYNAEERKYPGGQVDTIELPDKEVRGYLSEESYRFLGEDGLIESEYKVGEDDVLIGKTSPPRFLEVMEEFGMSVKNRRESSVVVRSGEGGIVDKVMLSETLEGDKMVKVTLREQRIPEVGDKFASRHGQKGVIGLVIPQEDAPFTASGMSPDLLLNPHAIPSRMTVGQLLETLGGKVGSLNGRTIDGTPFSGEPERSLRDELHSLGFKSSGKEVMYDGITGQKLEAEIFIGVVYYQKLKHMVVDKIRARSRGPVQILTRQPTSGKAREGGLRMGEMEKDCLVAHGAALLLKERLLDESDKTQVPICTSCGMIAIYDKFRDYSYCTVCGDNVDIEFVEISYAFKLLLDELKSMSIYPKLVIGDKG